MALMAERSAEAHRDQGEEDDEHDQLERDQRVEAAPGAEDRRRLVVVRGAGRGLVFASAQRFFLAGWRALTRLASSRYAPGTPAGSWRKNESPV